MTKEPVWQFWIDVGGTFTDCLAVDPWGQERFSKFLSSGIVKGTTQRVPGCDRFLDAAQVGNVDGFWKGAELRLLGDEGVMIDSASVIGFDSATGLFTLDRSLFVDRVSNGLVAKYELESGLPAPILAIHWLQQIPLNQPLQDCRVDLGTTRGTNALLTRSGAKTALITSFGFRDFLRIGDQTRPKLFALNIEKLQPLFETAIEVSERVRFDGTVERHPDPVVIRKQLEQLKHTGIQSLAICFMFGYLYPDHEQCVATLAKEVGFESVCCSSEVAPLIKLISRGETTVLDAYLNPIIANYLDEVQALLTPNSELRLMTSAGGLVSRARFSGKNSVLSGPAGGVVGAARIAGQAGFERVIGFDMGGTSTDVSRFDGSAGGGFERSFETQKAGVRIVSPMLEVETVAAGGGSVCRFDGTKLCVGPESAGAKPGPASYGSGGPLAITDINLFLGRIQTDWFPFALDRQVVASRLQELCDQLKDAGFEYSQHELAEGFWKIANHNMSAAIQTVSIAQGYDPRDFVLLSFGGAGSQHCCGVAEILGMAKILDHPQSSILSAVGIRLADQTAHAVETVGWEWGSGECDDEWMDSDNDNDNDNDEDEVGGLRQLQLVFARLTQQAIASLIADGNTATEIEVSRSLDLRYIGTDACLTISVDDDHDWQAEFYRQHQQHYGYLQQRAIEIVAARVDARVTGNRLTPLAIPTKFMPRSADKFQSLWQAGQCVQAKLFERASLQAGDLIAGPAVIADQHSTTVVDRAWQAKVLADGVLLIESTASQLATRPPHSATVDGGAPSERSFAEQMTTIDPVLLEIFNSHFTSIAKQMGESLQKTSVSVNVKERLDFSCAIFTNCGDLVVNAPHIPVHLGAMSETVRAIIQMNSDVRAGDVFVTNDPYAGGSHLPDVTVVTPVFDRETGTDLFFWVASRSHHAEIGGSAPGSMPAGAKCLGEEGVLIQNFRLVRGQETGSLGAGSGAPRTALDPRTAPPTSGKSDVGVGKKTGERFAEFRALLISGPFPSRSPDTNIADVKAQVAANQTGLNQLRQLVDKYSIECVLAYMSHIQNAAELKSRAALRRLPEGEFRFEDSLDNGATIRVLLVKQNDELSIDFAGTNGVLPDNLNANRAIVMAATMYVMRMLIAEDIPLNEGVMKGVTIHLPECFLNPTPAANPFNSPAIVGGNVETSQRIVDVLLGALRLAAASQGTMNNWLMGGATFGYYETIGGGAGATPRGAGADAVHTHMTNTRLTDPEILESRYPVVLREFAIRRGSGGDGLNRGGDGIIREIEFLTELTVSLLTSRRSSQPYGMAGGQPGATGLNLLRRAGMENGEFEVLPSRCEIDVALGDRLRLETPGGGGWGPIRSTG